MSARYFFHASETAIYGPVPIETIRRWRTEGRLRDDSKLCPEGERVYTTAKEVLAAAPASAPQGEPEIRAEADAAADVPVPPLFRTPSAEAPIPVSRLIMETLPRYGEAVRQLAWVAALIQLPAILLSLALPGHVDPDTGAMSGKFGLFLMGMILIIFIAFEFGLGFMALTLRPGLPPLTVPERGRLLGRRAKAILWTLTLRLALLTSLFILFLFCIASARSVPPSPLLQLPLHFLAALAGLPMMVLALRYLPSTVITLLERKKGLAALSRSNDLVRFNHGSGLISQGDFRLFLMVLPAVALQIFLALVVSALIPHLHLSAKMTIAADIVLPLVVASLTLPLYGLLLVSFYVDALPRVPREEEKSEPKLETRPKP
ncbi:hypothetical protein [Verrucomicrobium sp. GAS474]|uniref:hypothetical protein n=1 Tax=Verrucomicrobium sp. GAS474 TaxID=1882831 RepID=UPI000B850A1A|nr:hypothetical protein [Verrucomicrobium sp. GAS474]